MNISFFFRIVKHKMQNFKENFKRMYLAADNTRNIFKQCPNVSVCTEQDMLNVQNFIFEKYFDQVMKEQDTIDLQTLLASMNTAAKKQFEFLENSKKQKLELEKPTPFFKDVCMHFYSNDSQKSNGRYNFKFNLNGIYGLALEKLKFDCSLYNITDVNNKIEILEHINGGASYIVTLPIGYYSIENVLYCMTELFTKHSPNKLQYKASLNFVKNKIHISCANGSEPCSFTLKFIESGIGISLKTLLGFQKHEYSSNNVYVSENMPIVNMLSNVYLKLYINDVEISKVKSSNTFSYFEEINIDQNEYFGKCFYYTPNTKAYFEFDTPVNLNTVSFEFVDQWFKPFNQDLTFECAFTFECVI